MSKTYEQLMEEVNTVKAKITDALYDADANKATSRDVIFVNALALAALTGINWGILSAVEGDKEEARLEGLIQAMMTASFNDAKEQVLNTPDAIKYEDNNGD